MFTIASIAHRALIPAILLFSYLSYSQVGIGTTSPTAQLTVNEDATFNESGGDHDFRVESDTNANMFFIDADQSLFGFNAVPNNVSALGGYVSQIYGVFEVGNDSGLGYQIALGPYLFTDPVIAPETDFFGYNGVYDLTNQNAWYEVNSYDYYNISNRETKRNIVAINDSPDLESYVMNDIDRIKPSFYKYNHDLDTWSTGKENKFRPQLRLGVITDESPDYVTDATKSKIDVYAISTLSLAGVKYNKAKIEKLEALIETEKINDFGSAIFTGNELWIDFDASFKNDLNTIPVITVTSNDPNTVISITKKSKSGFLVKTSKHVTDLNIDWIAMGKRVKSSNKNVQTNPIPQELKLQLEIPTSTRSQIINFYRNNKLSTQYNNKPD